MSVTILRPLLSTLFPYTTLFRSDGGDAIGFLHAQLVRVLDDRAALSERGDDGEDGQLVNDVREDRKSTRLNSSHITISYAVFCLKKKKTNRQVQQTLALCGDHTT